MRRKISWTDGRTDRGKTVYPPHPPGSGGIITFNEYVQFLNRLYDITKFNDSSILIMIISWNYLNLSFANEYVGDVTIPTQVIKLSMLLKVDQPIKLQYSHPIKSLLGNCRFQQDEL